MKNLFFLFLIFSIKANAQCFVVGADLSYANTVLANGGLYRDANNNLVNPYQLFAQKGANMVRMRLWHTPENNINSCGNPITSSNLNDVIAGFTAAKNNGMQLNLAIHYGDYFNDPGKQKRPQAWVGLTGTVLLDSIYNYTYNVLQTLKNNNVLPDIVAIGNETTYGFIDETEATNGFSFPEDANKFNSALNAVDDFNSANNTSVKKAVHFTDNTASYLAGLFTSNAITNYDIIGVSFYPFFSDFNNLNQLSSLISTLKNTYNKDVMIFETGIIWTNSGSDNYSNFINSNGNFNYPITPQGQKDYFQDIVTTVYNAGGTGVLYWEPDWISSNLCDIWNQGSSYENASFFNFNDNNKELPAFDVFNFCNTLSNYNQKKTEIYIYPNPVKNILNFENLSNETKIDITDLTGRKIISKEIISNTIDISTLNSGVYFINFKNDVNLKSIQFIKE
jgi:arabinogalactan endo-1,4-beta-galactosidase